MCKPSIILQEILVLSRLDGRTGAAPCVDAQNLGAAGVLLLGQGGQMLRETGWKDAGIAGPDGCDWSGLAGARLEAGCLAA